LGTEYDEWGDSKKAKFHYEAAAMAGHEQARYNLGYMEYNSRNIQRAIKHWIIGASAGDYDAMHALLAVLKQGLVSRDAIDSTLAAYNNSSVEIQSESRDAFIRLLIDSRFHG
jgi:TPR repeat protein